MSERQNLPDYRSVPLHDKSVVLHLAEDVKAVADVTAHVNTQRDLRAAAQVMLETIDAAYALRDELEALKARIAHDS